VGALLVEREAPFREHSVFSAACEVGAVISGAPDGTVTALRDYGNALGIAFQIADDLLDVGGASAVMGKHSGDDFRERKMTLPVILAVSAANEAERGFWERCIVKGDQTDADFARARELMLRHGALDRTRERAFEWAGHARRSLDPLPPTRLRGILVDLADHVVDRLR
ncbi:MAG: polyprenyl synthetase family protein, partial [Paracoccaceae bacterium]